jgi:amino acid adenylation domain-containing protein
MLNAHQPSGGEHPTHHHTGDPMGKLRCFNPAKDVPPVFAAVTEWLSRGIKNHNDAAALTLNDITLRYGELDLLSTRIANYLIGRGIGHGDRVGLCLNRSVEMVAALIGILKAGAAYVPLDPEYPPERLEMMVEDAGLRCLLTHADHAGRFDAGRETVFIWEEIAAEVETASTELPDIRIDPEDTAYVIFTSGSTGRPKGIAMPHRALANLIEWQLNRSSFRPGARVLQYSSISFDVSFQEIATTLASGGTLVLISDEDRKDPRTLLDRLVKQKIERLFLPYVAMRSMIEAAHVLGVYPDGLKEIITAGEQLRIDEAVRSFFDRIDGAVLDNQYGPSETHVITAHLLEGEPSRWPDLPPIGTPLANNSVFILDEQMRPVDVAQEGELFLAGRNLAHGYLHREEETREAFIPNPLGIPERPLLYKTGDLGAYNEDGSINFLGRKDHQVKIRGHRVEPGEINAAAARLPGIEQCLTHAVFGKGGGARLATWYVVKEGASVDPAVLRRHLSEALPDYMVPVYLVEIDRIPYTPSGKVDLKTLPSPSAQDGGYAPDELRYISDTEKSLAGIWSEVLELDGIPRTAGFFDLGGDSLRAVTLFLKIRQQLGPDLPLAAITRAPTLEELAQLIDAQSAEPAKKQDRSLQMMQSGRQGEVPLILVHGGKGNILVYNRLVQELNPDLPVYGLQWPGWDGRPGERSIPAMAKAYVDELTRNFPNRSFRLGGYCIGALIAIEMSRLLQRQGIGVEGPLLVWDAPNIMAGTYHKGEPWNESDKMGALQRLQDDLVKRTLFTGSPLVELEREFYDTGLLGLLQRLPGLRPAVQWTKMKLRLLPVVQARLSGREVPMQNREHHCLTVMLRAVKKYRYPQYAGSVVYFRSYSVLARDLLRMKGWWNDPLFGFGELCTGPLETYVVGGPHHGIMEIEGIAAIVTKACGLDAGRNSK